jgi:lipid A 3-O-deacylase
MRDFPTLVEPLPRSPYLPGLWISYNINAEEAAGVQLMRVHLLLTTVMLGLAMLTGNGEEPVPSLREKAISQRLDFQPSMSLSPPAEDVHQPHLGEGFTSGTREVGFSIIGGFGLRTFGSRHPHDLSLGSLHYGWIFSDVVAKGHWYQGNWELIGELFGGAQYNSHVAYIAGITPGLRYNFITGTRFVPFVHGGVGATLTDIRTPDLGSVFQFNLQGGVGIHWFWRENAAFTAQYRFMHISNAGIHQPNQGINAHVVIIGASWFFGGAHSKGGKHGAQSGR